MADTPQALQNRLRLAHQARRAKEHQLDDIRRALCDIGAIEDDDPYGHADLADIIRQIGPLPTEGEKTVTVHVGSLEISEAVQRDVARHMDRVIRTQRDGA